MKHPVHLLDNQMVTLEKGLRKIIGDGYQELFPQLLPLFRRYIDLILSWNRKISLISTADEEWVVKKHILPSLGICEHIPNEPMNWLDIGSGAGFPAIPVKIMRERINLLMVESTRKKALFLMKVVRELNLKNSKVIWTRLEELPLDRKHKIITARAVENPRVILQEASKRLQSSGQIFYLRGKRGTENFQKNMPAELSIDEITKLPNFTRSPKLYLMKLRLCDGKSERDKGKQTQ